MPKVSNIHVPNTGPKDAKIVAVGESPGWDEENNKDENERPDPQPFVGRAGEKLMLCLNRNAIPRESVYLANLYQNRPYNLKFYVCLQQEDFSVQLENLYNELREIKPNIIVALGAWPMWFLTGKCGKDKGKVKPGTGILARRGSIYKCIIKGLESTKVLCTLHPSFVSRNAEYYPAFDQDIKRAISESSFRDFRFCERKYVINPTAEDLEYLKTEIKKAEKVALDIETFGTSLACLGVATSPYFSTCIPDSSTLNQEFIRWILESEIPKVFHFGTFDTEYLRDKGYRVNNWVHDTFILQRVLWPQLPRTLAYLTSIHTDMPYYKDEGKEAESDSKTWSARSVNLNQLWIYNNKDCCVTYEICDDFLRELDKRPELKKIYDFDMEAARHDAPVISRAGMLIDPERVKVLREALRKVWIDKQKVLNSLAGSGEPYSKKLMYIDGTNIPQLVNANSSKQVQLLLYGTFGLKQRKKKGGKDEESKTTADEQAILSMLSEAKREYDNKVRPDAKDKWLRILIALKSILIIRGVRKKLSSYINVEISKDGRARSLYKLGAETGRWAANKWIDKTGWNAMTIPRDKVEVEV